MKLLHEGIGGTDAKGDVLVTVSPGTGTIDMELTSSVLAQYGQSIRQAVEETLARLHVTDARVIVADRGAIDHTIRARVATAVLRAGDVTEQIRWGDL